MEIRKTVSRKYSLLSKTTAGLTTRWNLWVLKYLQQNQERPVNVFNSPVNIGLHNSLRKKRGRITDPRFRHVVLPVGKGVGKELPPGPGELQNAQRPGQEGGKEESRARVSVTQTALLDRAGQGHLSGCRRLWLGNIHLQNGVLAISLRQGVSVGVLQRTNRMKNWPT